MEEHNDIPEQQENQESVVQPAPAPMTFIPEPPAPKERAPRHAPTMASIMLVAILFGLLAGFGGTVLGFWAVQHGYLKLPTGDMVETSAGRIPTTGSSGQSLPNFIAVAGMLNNSVVYINTTDTVQVPTWPFGSESQVRQGVGTGMIVSKDGYILTNYHVAGNPQAKISVIVKGPNGKKEYAAEHVGGDEQLDLAVIKINADNLQPVTFGDSDKLQPGEWVMAIGNPFEFDHTVSVGVVSALNRSLDTEASTRMRELIQTDAAINPGNSGGPLVNLRGEVIGINTMIYLGNGNGPQANSIGFAIPSNRARSAYEQILKTGHVQRPYLGVSYKEIDEAMRNSQHLPVQNGALVDNIFPGGPADQAGIKSGDIITMADGQALSESDALGTFIVKKSVGDTLTLEVRHWNEGQATWATRTVQVRIGDAPSNFAKFSQRQQPEQQQPQAAPNPFGF